MRQPEDIETGLERPAKRSPGKIGYLGAIAIALGAVIGFGNEPAPAQSPAVAESMYTQQLETAKKLEAHAYQTQSVADYRAAASALEDCSRTHPENLPLHQSLGYLYLDKLKQPELAFPHLQAVYAATPEAPGWGQMLAKAAGETGRNDLQIQVLTEVTKRNPNDQWCRLDLANALNKAGRFAEADQAFQDALKIAPNDEWINISYAQFLKSRGRDSEAGRIARNVLGTHPKSTLALTFLAGGKTAAPANQPVESAYTRQLKAARALEAHAYQTQSVADYRAAAVALEKCSRAHPEDMLLHRSLGYIYLEKLKQPELAFPHLQAVYAATPEARGWGQMLAKAAGETGRTDLQIQVLKDTAKREPHDPWCRLDLANALNKAGRYAEAELAFQDALKIAPDDEWINISYAQFLKSRGRDSEAESIARKVLVTHPKSTAALTLLGDIRQGNSDFSGAQAAYAQALASEPSSLEAKTGLSELHLSQSPQLRSSGYAFSGNDHFFQSGLYNTLTAPVLNHLFVKATFNTGWFHNNDTSFSSQNRYQEGLGLEYRPDRTLSFEAGASGFEVRDHDLLGFNVASTWKPTQNFWMYGSFRLDDPVTDSIATVAIPLSQDVVGLSSGYQISKDISADITATRAWYSDGNTRNFIHAEPFTYMLWRPIQLRVGPVYELLDYRMQKSDYPSSPWYHTFGPMIEVEPYVCTWLSIKARGEATRTSDDTSWGTIISAGPSVHLGKTFEFTAEYLYDNVPGPFSNYSGNGVRAQLSYRF
jgi:predicted Zn-dependent protease